MPRPRFDPNQPLVAARSFTYFGHDYKAGDAFPIEGAPAIPSFKLKTLYGSRSVNHGEATAAEPEAVSQVAMEASPGGWYNISAPWLDEAERVRGKVKAERRVAELEAEGEPACHHGVCVEEGQNGWWMVQADWMDNDAAYNIHGEAAAREQAAKLREEGPPPDPRLEPTVTAQGEGEPFLVNAPWLAEAEEFTDGTDAEQRRVQLREAGPPEGWEPAPETE